MDGKLVGPQIEFILENNKAGSQTLDIVAHEMLLIKMPLQGPVVFEELIVQALLLADVAFVVFLVQMLVQAGNIVEAFGFAEFAEGVSKEARGWSVAVFHMLLQLSGSETGQPRNKVPLVFHA